MNAQEAAARLIDENAVISWAALGGDLEALNCLLALGLQSAYLDGYKVAAGIAGVQL